MCKNRHLRKSRATQQEAAAPLRKRGDERPRGGQSISQGGPGDDLVQPLYLPRGLGICPGSCRPSSREHVAEWGQYPASLWSARPTTDMLALKHFPRPGLSRAPVRLGGLPAVSPMFCTGLGSRKAAPANTNLQVSRDHPAVRKEVVGHLAHGVLYALSLAVFLGFQTGDGELGLTLAEDGQHATGHGFRGFLHGLSSNFHCVQTYAERSAFGKIRARDREGKSRAEKQSTHSTNTGDTGTGIHHQSTSRRSKDPSCTEMAPQSSESKAQSLAQYNEPTELPALELAGAGWWFLTRVILPPGRYLETAFDHQGGGGCYWHLVGTGQGCCSTAYNKQPPK